MKTYDRERSVALEAVLEASRVCQAVQASLAAADRVQKKDRSPVTVADFSAQVVISTHLHRAFPSDPIVAEESAEDFNKLGDDFLKQRVIEAVGSVCPGTTEETVLAILAKGQHGGGPSGRFWSIDPVDGTKGFLRGEQYAVSLALIEDGVPVLGVLGCPNYPKDWNEPDGQKGFLFVAVQGEGAASRDMSGSVEERIAVSDIDSPGQAVFCESVESGHSSHGDSAKIAERLGVTASPLRLDSQCKYAALSRADASIYLRLPVSADYEEKIWDHAAGWIILKEAGGRISDAAGKPLDFSRGRKLTENRGVVATNGRIHDAVIEAVQAVLS